MAEQTSDPLEADAIARLQAGEANAYDYLVGKYLKRVVSIAWSIIRNAHDAEDLAQEAFVKGYRAIGRFTPGEPFGPWIYRIVTNLALDLAKHRKRVVTEELSGEELASRRDSAPLAATTRQLSQRIDAAIESLPEMQRLVARLNLVEQFEHGEVAAMTGLSEGTVRSHLSLARKKLREQLADLYGGEDE